MKKVVFMSKEINFGWKKGLFNEGIRKHHAVISASDLIIYRTIRKLLLRGLLRGLRCLLSVWRTDFLSFWNDQWWKIESQKPKNLIDLKLQPAQFWDPCLRKGFDRPLSSTKKVFTSTIPYKRGSKLKIMIFRRYPLPE